MTPRDPKNPNFAIAVAYVNGNGEVVRFVKADGMEFETDYYVKDEKKRIEKGAFLVTENYCRWILVEGNWKCVPY